MTKLHHMRRLLTYLPLLLASTLATRAQSVKPLIDSQTYTFTANTAHPEGSVARGLSNFKYTIRITKDTIVCGLPYWGRASAATDDNQNPLNFTSSKFSYTIAPRKDGWKVSIRPKDTPTYVELQLVIGPDGYTSVSASFVNRDPISFDGAIATPENPN